MSPVARLAILALSASWGLNAQPTLVLYIENPLTEPGVEIEMKAEFAEAAATLGFRSEWRALVANKGDGEPGQLIVIRLSGDCSTHAAETAVSSGAPLASVQEVEGRILPFIEVHCGALTALVQPSMRGRAAGQQRSLLGRALARVLAHEVHHIQSQTARHTDQGVTQARLNRTELTQPAAEAFSQSDGR